VEDLDEIFIHQTVLPENVNELMLDI